MLFLKNNQNLPTKIKVNDNEYPIQTDYRYWLTFEMIISDPTIDDKTKYIVLLNIIVSDSIHPNDMESVLHALFSFYALHKKHKQSTSKKKDTAIPYHYQHDWPYIYAAFKEQYKIDLFEEKMHWFCFKALFDSLDKDTQFMKIVGYRAMDITSIKDKEMKKQYLELQKQYALPKAKKSTRSAKDIEKELEEKLKQKKGGSNDNE